MVGTEVIIINQGNSVEILQSEQGRIATLHQIVGKASPKELSGLGLEEAGHGKVFRKIVPSRGTSKSRGSEAGTCLAECEREISRTQTT